MQVLHQADHYIPQEHSFAFNAVAYTCGGIYALGQLTFQGIGKGLEATWDTIYELSINAISGLYQVGKAISFGFHHTWCVAQMIYGVVAPFFRESWHYTGAFFYELWKFVSDLPESVLCGIEVPGSAIGRLLGQLYSDTKAGLVQIGVFAEFVFEVIREIRDFGTIGAIIKDCVQLLGAGVNEIIKLFIAAWKETEIPRHYVSSFLVDFAHYIYRGWKEIVKLLNEVGEGIVNVLAIPWELFNDSLWDSIEYLFSGFMETWKATSSFPSHVKRALEMPMDFLWAWMKEFGGYLIAGIWEMIKVYDAVKEDLGNSWQNFFVVPLKPYTEAALRWMNELLAEMEKVVNEVQRLIFGN